MGVDSGDVPYPIYVVTGIVLWQSFADALFAPILSIQSNKAILSKIFFKRVSIFSAAFLETLFDLGIRLVLLFFVFLYYSYPHFGGFILVIPAVLFLILFGFSIGCLLAPIGALFSDISKGLNVVLTFWFFITPIVYHPSSIGSASNIINLNPVTHLLGTCRTLLLGEIPPISTTFLLWCLSSVVLLGLALYLLRISFPHLITRMGS